MEEWSIYSTMSCLSRPALSQQICLLRSDHLWHFYHCYSPIVDNTSMHTGKNLSECGAVTSTFFPILCCSKLLHIFCDHHCHVIVLINVMLPSSFACYRHHCYDIYYHCSLLHHNFITDKYIKYGKKTTPKQ